MPPAVLPSRWRLPYLGLLALAALLLGLSSLQAYRQGGGTRAWEPFLWEGSSVLTIGALALGLHALQGPLRGRPWLQQAAAHALALPLFSAAHIAGTFALRGLAYTTAGLPYQADPWPTLLVYEGGKDAVSYIAIVLISRGLWSAQAAASRERELERMRRELAEARLARLADQVQPHFLFNTLNLVSQVMYEDVPRADRLLCQLADLLRQTLAAQQRAEHPLADELALVEPFLALMGARFGGERLAVRLAVDADAARCTVPSLLLLSPVENAVKHHVARCRGLVTVAVQARRDGTRLQIEVRNTAEGPPPEPAAPGADDGGLGLRNLQQRLHARHGSAAHAQLLPVPGGMALRLELPCGC